MQAMFYYLLKANIIMAVMVMIFFIFFRREKFLQLNRFLLMAIAALSFILPVCPAIIYQSSSAGITYGQVARLLNAGNSFVPTDAIQSAGQGSRYSMADLFICSYLFVSAIFFVRLFLQIMRTMIIIQGSEKKKESNMVFCRSAMDGPFSFFHYIVIPQTMDTAMQQQVILHEQAHAKHRHTIDILLSEITGALCWLNPFVYLYKKLVRINLEFLADNIVLKAGTDRTAYQLSLLRHIIKRGTNTPAISFFSSNIKTRIGMMNAESPSNAKRLRYLLMMPVLFIIYLITNPPQAVAALLVPHAAVKEELRAVAGNQTAKSYNEKPGIVIDKKKSGTPKITQAPRIVSEAAPIIVSPSVESTVYVDAKTDTVRFKLVPSERKDPVKFEGIYLIDGKEYMAKEIRELAASGDFEIHLSARPRIAYYSPNDENAIQRWGSKAAKGLILIEPLTSVTP